ncbi:MAG: hypothetical protein AXW17_12290 [Colwellia sp. Phe_37]|nr:MAG: hypothetical protein AXW17_12290 [Colwellia sp. Phe_37]
MNKLVFIGIFCISILLAACGGSSDSKTTTQVVSNNAPTITIATTQRFTAGQTIDFSAEVSDPDGDSITVTWQADNDHISFSNTTGPATTISFPDVDSEQIIKITITATDSKGKSTSKTITVTLEASIAANLAPIISLPATLQAKGGESIVLVATVQDPQGDDVTVAWQSTNSAVIFSDTTSLTPTLTLPDVTSPETVLIKLIATDSQSNQSEKTLTLSIIPGDGAPEPSVQFELAERFETASGDVTTLTANITSNVEITTIDWNLTTLGSVDASVDNNTVDNVTTTEVTFTAPSLAVAKEHTISLKVTTASGHEFSANSRVFIAASSEASLEVNLAESYLLEENSTLSITPEIIHSHAISTYQWQWLSTQEMTLITPESEILSLSAPNVDGDITGQLSLTVTMGALSKTVVTEVTIKNKPVVGEIDVVASRLVVVQGQTIKLSVITDNFEQITSWSWESLNVEGLDIKESKAGYEMTAPQVTGQQTMSVVYRATLSDGSTIQEIGNFTVLSEAMARSSIDIEITTVPVIKSHVETVIEFPFIDRHELVDSISLNTANTFNSFEKSAVSLAEGKVQLILKVSDLALPANHTDYISINVKFGVHELPFIVELAMINE